MKKELFLTLVLAAVVLSGCLEADIKPAAKQLTEIKAIYDEYPSAYMTTLYMQKDAVAIAINDISKECEKEMPIQDYWYITVKVNDGVTEFYTDRGVTQVMCTVLPEKKPLPIEHECDKAEECDDNNPATEDLCKGNPRICLHIPITNCKTGDGYCPEGCLFKDDGDCPAIDMCQSDIDCTDSNNLTKDECTGTPKYCKYTLKSCEEMNKYLCEDYEECKGEILPTTDRGVCCNVQCSKTKSCEGVVCESYEKCVNGECYKKLCGELGLPLCTIYEECTGQYYKDDRAITCCDGECRKPCETDSDCGLEEMCDGEYCIVKECADIGGRTCQSYEKCAGEIERTLDNDECCTQCVLKKCEGIGGIICDIEEGEECYGNTRASSDSDECCLGECTIDWCFDKPCAINKKCESQKCVFKTCEEMEGMLCDIESHYCTGDLYRTSNTPYCCVGACISS